MRIIMAAMALVLMMAGRTALSMAQGPDAEAVFKQHCAACHAGPKPVEGVPNREALRQLAPEAILNSMVNGKMQVQANPLTEVERIAVAEHLAGRPLTSAPSTATANRCSQPQPMSNPATLPSWNGWGNGPANTRFQAAGLTAGDLPKLKLKWAFGYANVSAARAQPAVVGGRLFAASENGELHALDPATGCSYWSYKAQAGSRTAPSVGTYKTASGTPGNAVYFGDSRANVYALDAQTGQLIWTRKVDDHAAAAITGAPTVHDGRVYVPVQGLNEEIQGGGDTYPCCTFRGSLSALDASTGAVIWKTYTIAEAPRPHAKNDKGVQMWGPSGVSVWSAPTVDAKRRLVYFGTGNGYSDPIQPNSDAVMALDVATGAVKWSRQLTPGGDSWLFVCMNSKPGNPACPKEMGPDFDFSASPILTTAQGRDLLVIPQKSGMAYALDPDKQGALVWQQRFGKGSAMGGQWGGTVDAEHFYVGVADLLTPTPGGMRALKLIDGQPVWQIPPQSRLCGDAKNCLAGQGGALTGIPGAVLNGALDGGLRAYSTKDGRILWQFDTNREFETVNGVQAKGGGMDGPGPVVVGRMLFVNSGYGGVVGRPGNVLLAFGLD
jgi:polyvinyl alcohol dehydrogenase (cytochrome)